MQNDLYGGGVYPQTREQAAADAARRLGGTSRQPMQPASSYSQMQPPRQQMTQGLSSQAPLSKPLHSMYGSYLAMSPRQASSAMGMQAGAGRQRTRSSSPLSPSMQAGAFPQSSQQVADSEAMRMRAGGLGYAASSGAISGQPQPPVATQGGLVPRPVDPQQYGARPTLSPNQGRTPMSPRLADVIARSPSLQVEPYPLKSQISAAMGVTDQQVLPLTPDTAVDKYTQAMPQQSENATVVAGAAQGSRVPSVAISSGSMPYQLPVQGLPDASPQRSSGTISENSVFYPQSLRASGEQPQTTAAATQGDASQQAKQPFSAPISTGSMPYALPLRGVPEAPAPASEPISTEATPVSQAIAPEPQPNTPQPNTPQTLQSLWGANRPQEMLADSYMKMTGRADAARQYAATADAIKQGQLQDMQVMQDQREAFQAENNRIRDSLRNTQAGLAEMTERDMQRSSYAPMVNREADRLAARNDRIDAVNNARAGLEERFDGGPVVYKGVTVNPSVAARNLSMSDSRKASLAAQGYEVDPETGVVRRGRQVAPGSGGSIGGSPEQIATQMIAGGYANEDERDAIENRVYESRRRYGMNPSGGDQAPSGVERAILARTDLTDQQKGIYLGARAARMKSRGRPLSPMAEALTMGAIDVPSMPGYNRGVDSAPMTMPSMEKAASNIAAMDAAAGNPQVATAGSVGNAGGLPVEAAAPQAAAAAVPGGDAGRTGLPRDARSPSVSYNITVGDYFNKSLGEQMDLRNRRMNIAAANGNPIAQRLIGNLRSQQEFDQQMDPTQPQDFKSRMELMRFENEMATAAQDRQLAAEARDYDRKMKEYKIAVDAGADPAEAARALGLGGDAVSVQKSPYPSAEDVRRTGVEQGMNYAQINQGISQRDAMEKLDAKRASGDPDAAKVTSIRPSTLPQESTAYERVEDFINRLAGAGYKGFSPAGSSVWDQLKSPRSQETYRDYVAESPGAFPPAETFLEAAAAEGITPADLREYYAGVLSSWNLTGKPASAVKAAYYLADGILEEVGDAPNIIYQNFSY